MMESTVLTTSLLIIISLLAGFSLSYLWYSARMIKRSLHEECQKELIQNREKLEHFQKLLDSSHNENLTIEDKLNKVEDLNNDLDKELSRTLDKLEYLTGEMGSKDKDLITLKEQMNVLSDSLIQVNKELSLAHADSKYLKDKMQSREEDFQELRKKSILEFKLTADQLLEQKTEKFTKLNRERMEEILKPLEKDLSAFKTQVRETYDKESKQRFSLEEKIKELMFLNQQISQEASNLTKALKGNSKTQGDWGEMILENILEYSGLTKNREYFVQKTFKSESGKIKKPDIFVKYPDDRYIIIDSKVSLTAYERMVNSDEDKLQRKFLAEHIKSIKRHIDDLSSKEYDHFDKTLDFVMLFIPVEPAYMIAMQQDPDLWTYAYSRKILLISPTNLIAALKMVSDIWKRDDQNKNARKIAKRGEILYDKFVGFVDDMNSIDKQLLKAGESWKDAMSKLKYGKGNLIGQAEKLRKMGLEPKKRLLGKELLKIKGEEE